MKTSALPSLSTALSEVSIWTCLTFLVPSKSAVHAEFYSLSVLMQAQGWFDCQAPVTVTSWTTVVILSAVLVHTPSGEVEVWVGLESSSSTKVV